MGATSKRAKKVRTSDEFNLLRLAAERRAPKTGSGFYAWDLDSIRRARDEQLIGKFQQPARLADAMQTDDAIFTAHQNRLAPQRGLPIKLVPPNDSARAKRVLSEADALFGLDGIGIDRDTLADINSQLADHGVAFGVNVVTPRPDGSRVDVEFKSWPIEYVWWNPLDRCFQTRVEGGMIETIQHADGRWTIFQKHELEPWKRGAAILPGAIVWAAHAYGIRDFAKASKAHGDAKIVGTPPPGIAIDDEEGQALLELLRVIASEDAPVGLKPEGATLDYITNNSNAWQVFKELVDGREKAAARIYLGQDGTQGTNPTAPGVDSKMLFGVRDDIVEGDLRAIERGILQGVIEPWCALNFGDSSLAPKRVYLMPDADEDARYKSISDRTKAFFDALTVAKAIFPSLSPDYVAKLAEDYGVRAPELISASPMPNAGVPQPSTAAPARVPAVPARLRGLP